MGSPNSNLAKPARGRTLLDGADDRIVGRAAQAFADEKRVPRARRRLDFRASGSCAHSRGHTLLEWKPAQKNGFYFVTISSDFAATHVIRQYFTADPKLDLRAADRQLVPGTTYYWQVDAIAPNGKLIMSGPVQSFVAEASPQASLSGDGRLVQLASLGIPKSLPVLPDLAAEIAGRTPTPDSSISQLQPTISVSFQPAINPADVSLMVDDVDITSLAQVTEVKVAFTPPLALTGGDHNVNLTVGNEAATWKFTVVARLLLAVRV